MPLELLASPVVDGVFLKDEPANLLERAEFSPKPVMLGTTGDEFEMVNNRSWYKGLGIAATEDEFFARPMTEAVARALQAAELMRCSTPDVVNAFLATRGPGVSGSWGSMPGTLGLSVDKAQAARIVERATVS